MSIRKTKRKKFVRKSREVSLRQQRGETMGVKVFDYDRGRTLGSLRDATCIHSTWCTDLDPDEEQNANATHLPLPVARHRREPPVGRIRFSQTGANGIRGKLNRADRGRELLWRLGISVGDLNADRFEDVFIAASMS